MPLSKSLVGSTFVVCAKATDADIRNTLTTAKKFFFISNFILFFFIFLPLIRLEFAVLALLSVFSHVANIRPYF